MSSQDQKNIIQVINPKVMPVKGWPSRRQKSVLEQEAKKPLSTNYENANQYTCSNCHAKGHNIRSYNLPRYS